MAVTKQTYDANGSQTQFTLPFEYIAKADVDVYIDDVLQLQQNTTSTADATHPQVISGEITQGTALINYTFANDTTIAFNSAPANGAFLFIERTTDDGSVVTFVPGSTIRAQELNDALEQVRFMAQEGVNTAKDGVTPSRENSQSVDARGLRVENVADANSDDDAVNRAQLGKVITDDLLEGEAIDLTDTTGGSNSNKQVTISVEDSSKTNKGAVSINEGHAIGVTYTSGDAVIAADKSTASQQGVVQISTPSVTNGNPITLTRPADGEVELTIADGSIDVQKIKGLDKADTSEYASTWNNDDDQVATVGAIAKRLDAIVSTSQPTTAQVGKFWYNPTEGINALYMWQGTEWKVLTSGTPYIPAGTTIVRYVDAVNGSDAAGNSGFLPQSPLRSIKRAITLINASSSGDGTLVVVEPGVYQEVLPLRIEKNNVSVVGKALRSCFIHPTVATENNNMWEVDSGTYIANFTMLGLKVPTNDQGSRNNSIDNDSTYGLPSNQPFAISFRSGNPVILKSPYIQNCTHFSDAHFDNANFDPNTFPSTDSQTYSAVAGDQTSAPCGGGLLVDGSVPAQSSPIRSMVVDAFTQITLDGPGILVTNNGYAQLVSFFGTFCHYHAKAKNGGQINLSNCVTDFGRYGLIAEGKSPTAIATATASAANAGATTVTIGAISSASSFHGTVSRPLDHMMMTIDGADYGVVSSTANGSGWNVTITPALASNISNTAVSFALRSYISTGGHTFEYVGVGTDYSDHPDNGGVPVEANQVKQLSGGKVWQSSTDHIGKFKAGNVLTVDQIAETLAVNGNITVTGTNTVNGNITVTGTVDGRDVATDGTKLDGIEAGATADQTAAEIRTLVESATDSNVFTDADHTKLNGIAAGATAYANSNVDAHLNRSTASNGEVLSWNGSDYDWVAAASGGASSLNGLSDAVVKYTTTSTSASIGIGENALNSDDSSDNENTAVGTGALQNNTTGPGNEAFGRNALNSNTTGFSNAAFGNSSLSSNTTGDQNVAVGSNALGNGNTTHNGSTAIGYRAGRFAASNYVTGVGYEAALNATTPVVCLGHQAGKTATSAIGLTAIGYQAGDAITTGNNNTCVGSAALGTVTTGSENTAVGYSSMGSAATGAFYNTAVGYNALTNVQYSANTAVGYSAGSAVTSGVNCTLVGRDAGSFITTASSNTAVGSEALRLNTTGGSNTAFGHKAGNSITTGSNLTVIGYDADASSATATNEITLGNASVTSLRIPGLQSGASNGQVLTYNSSNGNITLATASGGPPHTTTGTGNLGLGSQALNNLSNGTSNVAVGNASQFNNASDSYNVSVGVSTLYYNNGGERNVALGYYALNANTTGDSNIAIGSDALKDNTTANRNIAIGQDALKTHQTGNSNVAIGYQSQFRNNGGFSNTSVGYEALYENSNGSNDGYCTAIGAYSLRYNTEDSITAIGYKSGYANTTGFNNTFVGNNAGEDCTSASALTAVGRYAGANVTTGNENTAIGSYALQSCATNSFNTAVGSGALFDCTGSNNVALGRQAGYNITSGGSNVAIGTEALHTNQYQSGNVAVGHEALYYTTGGDNIGVGYRAGYQNTTGAKNVFIGMYAGEENTTADGNVAIGPWAAESTTTGTYNTSVGSQALDANTTGYQNVSVGYNSNSAVTTAYYNVAVGSNAARLVTTGTHNTSLGHQAAENLTTGSNNTSLGYDAKPSASNSSNQVTLGNVFVSSLRCNTQTISSLSDGRDKTEVEDLSLGLEFIDALRPVKFKWDTRDGNGKDGSYEAGFIAQDLQTAQSDVNADYLGLVLDDNPDRLEASYGKLIPVLVQAIKDLKSEIETLKQNVL